MTLKKTISTFALCLSIAALTACSSARGESAATTTLEADTTTEACADKDAGCCAEAPEAKQAKSCCEEGDVVAPSDS